jgi:hypothetical protein
MRVDDMNYRPSGAARGCRPRRARRDLGRMAAWMLGVCLGAQLLFGATVLAQADPAARMGRLSLIVGQVEVRLDQRQALAGAHLNMPLGAMSMVRTAFDARAEVRLGSLSAQLEGNSSMVLRTVDDENLVLVLFYGELALHVPSLPAGHRVQLYVSGDRGDDALAFSITSPGRYHFLRRARASIFNIQTFEGQGQVVGITPAVPVAAGRQIGVGPALRGGAEKVPETTEARENLFTQWAAQRARRSVDGQSLRHVSAEMTGAEELDKHGSWSFDPRWGALWLPAGVDPDWAPYRQGRWVHTAQRGWAWVDDAAWGFAPFHYGRWLFNAGRWAWSPGARVEKPIYAPALVGFYGSSAEPGAWIGWFPLAPGEAFRPAFAASATFVQNLNAPAFERLVSQGYRYANTLFAATAMSAQAFAASQPAAQNAVRLTATVLSGTGVLNEHAPPPALVPVPAQPVSGPPAAAGEATLPPVQPTRPTPKP